MAVIPHNITDEVSIIFTNRALAEAETQTGKSVISFINKISSGDISINEIALYLKVGMEAYRKYAKLAGNKPVSLDDAYAVMDEVGFAKITEEVVMAIAEALENKSESKTNSNSKN